MTDIYALTDSAILELIGQKLKEARVEQNISQKALAENCGLSAFSISQMENGHNTSLLSLVMVLRALNRLEIFAELFREKPLSPVAISEYMKKNPRRQRAYTTKAEANKNDDSSDGFYW
ncbi:MAG: helix-turn-helix transcriptional regulator [Prevotella sp.]|nr:helix-turn-helix transcriptional regulator [Prevotella sp.]